MVNGPGPDTVVQAIRGLHARGYSMLAIRPGKAGPSFCSHTLRLDAPPGASGKDAFRTWQECQDIEDLVRHVKRGCGGVALIPATSSRPLVLADQDAGDWQGLREIRNLATPLITARSFTPGRSHHVFDDAAGAVEGGFEYLSASGQVRVTGSYMALYNDNAVQLLEALERTDRTGERFPFPLQLLAQRPSRRVSAPRRKDSARTQSQTPNLADSNPVSAYIFDMATPWLPDGTDHNYYAGRIVQAVAHISSAVPGNRYFTLRESACLVLHPLHPGPDKYPFFELAEDLGLALADLIPDRGYSHGSRERFTDGQAKAIMRSDARWCFDRQDAHMGENGKFYPCGIHARHNAAFQTLNGRKSGIARLAKVAQRDALVSAQVQRGENIINISEAHGIHRSTAYRIKARVFEDTIPVGPVILTLTDTTRPQPQLLLQYLPDVPPPLTFSPAPAPTILDMDFLPTNSPLSLDSHPQGPDITISSEPSGEDEDSARDTSIPKEHTSMATGEKLPPPPLLVRRTSREGMCNVRHLDVQTGGLEALQPHLNPPRRPF